MRPRKVPHAPPNSALPAHPWPPHIQIYINDQPITPSPSLTILGLTLQQNRSNPSTIQTLSRHAAQIVGLICRITARGNGPSEKERLQLVTALVTSRLKYSLPYLRLQKRNSTNWKPCSAGYTEQHFYFHPTPL
ncbi:hypothetical protein HPB48_021151 [Haemaphysalis longicornis]|uniref:Uncharacterized protein n=1 Tax=Haemaphysalis longicornis TaxID=44386 RepID=A0A9J6H1T1_HAELO|nr:hypothetical protein HPB48_021151 [Haemaphysalis longicornis]